MSAIGEMADRLNERLLMLETLFARENFVIPAGVYFDVARVTVLSFKKMNGEYQFVVTNEDGSETPLLKTPLETRMLAARVMAQLHESLKSKVDETIADIGSCITAVDECIEAVNRARKK